MITLNVGDFVQPKDTNKEDLVALIMRESDGDVELMWFEINNGVLHRTIPIIRHRYETVAARSISLGYMVGQHEALIRGEVVKVPQITWKHITNYDDTHVI